MGSRAKGLGPAFKNCGFCLVATLQLNILATFFCCNLATFLLKHLEVSETLPIFAAATTK